MASTGIMSVSYTHLDVYKRQDYELAYLYEYLNIENKSQVPNALIRELYHSTAELAIVQMQDIFCLLYTSRCV